MKLQILVPHYKETVSDMQPLLDSIAIQQNVDFNEVGLVIVHDGDEAIELPEEEWTNKYPFLIEHLHIDHCGVSSARNAGLDHSTADYVMFCDADDMFCHVCGLYIIFNEIKIGFDTLISCFMEETKNPQTGELIYVNHDMDSTFVHGKVHRRKYLNGMNIRFNPNLTIHEDSYFNILTKELADPNKAKYCQVPFYLWRWRDASVCRHDPEYILKTYNNMLDSNDALVDEFDRRGKEDKAQFYVAFMIFDAYYTMNKKEWIEQSNKHYRDDVELRFKNYYIKHKHFWDTMKDEERMALSNGVRSRFVQEGMPMESITINQWLDHISKVN